MRDEVTAFAARTAKRLGLAPPVDLSSVSETRDTIGREVAYLGPIELGSLAEGRRDGTIGTRLDQLLTARVGVLAIRPDEPGPESAGGLERTRAALAAADLHPTFLGSGAWPGSVDPFHVAVFYEGGRQPTTAPPEFRVAAIMTAFNERDIIRPSIQRLISQGFEVYLLNNWSQDDTVELVEDLVGHGLLAIENYPPGGRPEAYEWSDLLRRVAEVAADLPHDWVVHHDVDQRRESPWPEHSFRDALFTAQSWGFNCVDHTILEFRPIDDAFVDGTEVSEHLEHFEIVPAAATAIHVQAWKNDGQLVDLVASGGHDAQFDGRSTMPFNLVLRHYPVRSQRHGDLKVFRDRKPRYRSDELNKGWHHHYARLRSGHSFLYRPENLIRWRGHETVSEYLFPLIGQTGMVFPPPSPTDRARKRAIRALTRSGLAPLYVRARTLVNQRIR